MEHPEARRLLVEEITKYRGKSYSELTDMIGDEGHPAFETVGIDGVKYWLEIEARWDEPNQVVRLCGSICGGGIDYQVPMCDDFLKARDGTFVGE